MLSTYSDKEIDLELRLHNRQEIKKILFIGENRAQRRDYKNQVPFSRTYVVAIYTKLVEINVSHVMIRNNA